MSIFGGSVYNSGRRNRRDLMSFITGSESYDSDDRRVFVLSDADYLKGAMFSGAGETAVRLDYIGTNRDAIIPTDYYITQTVNNAPLVSLKMWYGSTVQPAFSIPRNRKWLATSKYDSVTYFPPRVPDFPGWRYTENDPALDMADLWITPANSGKWCILFALTGRQSYGTSHSWNSFFSSYTNTFEYVIFPFVFNGISVCTDGLRDSAGGWFSTLDNGLWLNGWGRVTWASNIVNRVEALSGSVSSGRVRAEPYTAVVYMELDLSTGTGFRRIWSSCPTSVSGTGSSERGGSYEEGASNGFTNYGQAIASFTNVSLELFRKDNEVPAFDPAMPAPSSALSVVALWNGTGFSKTEFLNMAVAINNGVKMKGADWVIQSAYLN